VLAISVPERVIEVGKRCEGNTPRNEPTFRGVHMICAVSISNLWLQSYSHLLK
jgi:hypothetical protein